MRRKLTLNQLNLLKNYLLNPLSVGIWTVKAKWHVDDSICDSIKNELLNQEDKKEIQTNTSKKKLKTNLVKNKVFLDNINSQMHKLTFLIRLFTYIYVAKKTPKKLHVSNSKRIFYLVIFLCNNKSILMMLILST